MKQNIKNILLAFTLWVIFITMVLSLTSCTSDTIPEEISVERTIRISNEGKPFEYWLGKVHYDSRGQEVNIIVDLGTQITLSAIVPVIDGVPISPNFQVYQDDRLVELRKVTLGFFWYEVK
jgi:hypothetical protein